MGLPRCCALQVTVIIANKWIFGSTAIWSDELGVIGGGDWVLSVSWAEENGRKGICAECDDMLRTGATGAMVGDDRRWRFDALA